MNDLYTEDVASDLRGIAVNASHATGGAVDADELFSVAECAVAKWMNRYDPTKDTNGTFRGAAAQRAVWAIKDYFRRIDMRSRQDRQAGVRGTMVCQLEAQNENFLDHHTSTPPDRGEARDEATRFEKVISTCLTAREALMVRSYFYDDQTLLQIGEQLGCTQQNVCLMMKKALRKLSFQLSPT